MSLHRCVICRAYTLAEPILVLRDRRMHLSACIECMSDDRVPFSSYLKNLHQAPLAVLLAIFVTGRWQWSI